jgi:hypothetical protein
MNPYLILGFVLALAASNLVTGYWQNGVGHVEERVEWQGRANEELAAANKKIVEGEERERALEARRVAGMAELAADYLQEKTKNEDRAKRDAAAARAGTLSLRIPASVCGSSGDPAGPPRPAAAGSDGASGERLQGATGTVVLPPDITEGLYSIVNACDQVADQLRKAQKIIINDRKE